MRFNLAVIAVLLLFLIGSAYAAPCVGKEGEAYKEGTLGYGFCSLVQVTEPWVGLGIGSTIILIAFLYVVAQFGGAEFRAKLIMYANTLLVGIILALVIYTILLPFLIKLVSPPATPSPFVNIYAKYYPLIVLSLTLAAISAVVSYLIAYLLQHPNFTAFAKEELASFIFSAVIIAFWLGSDALLQQMISAILSLGATEYAQQMTSAASAAGINGHIYLASASLDILLKKLMNIYAQLYLFEVLIGFLSTLSFPLGAPLPAVNMITITFMPYDGLALLSQAHTTVVEAIGFTVAAIMAKQSLLGFSRDVILLIFLPLGIILRAFPFWRGTGSSIIALCFTAYFVYPLSIIFSNYLIFDVYQPADFSYVPERVTTWTTWIPGVTASPQDIDNYVKHQEDEKREEYKKLFDAGRLTESQVKHSCGTLPYSVFNCLGSIIADAKDAVVGVFKTVGHMFVLMVKMTGDFFESMFNFALFPTATIAGLFKFIVEEVMIISQFVILVIITSVVEIIITITMYRNIAALIGGEIEIAGLSKLV